MDPISIILGILIGLILGAGATYFVIRFLDKRRKSADEENANNTAANTIRNANKQADEIIKIAEEKAEIIKESALEKSRNADIEAKNIVYELKQEAEKEFREKRQEIANNENRLMQKESALDKRDVAILERESHLKQKEETIVSKIEEADRKLQSASDKEHNAEVKLQEAEEKYASIEKELERVASLTASEARDQIFARVESQMSQEIALYQKNKEEEARETAETKAKEILALSMSKYSQEVTTERTVSVVALPSDDMKGRIIGREGRNIRTLEQLLGVDILIDDTPEVITVSCFDPIRRETARLTLEYLIKDGRIQPGRIEELAEKAKQDVQKSIHEAGINCAFKLGLPRINKDLLDYVGRLKYRTSYTQNALDHSMQVAYLCGIMAAELGLDQNLAKRAGLLHDIGKSADFELDGSHVEIGARLAKKYGEHEIVINAIESHHGDVEAKFIYSYLVQAADTLSAARPGARNETLENYIKRIEQLENICKEYDGISSAYAMQSGREVRIMVVPEKVDDLKAYALAREIKDKIENEMTYPGQIKVSVVREVRATEIAK